MIWGGGMRGREGGLPFAISGETRLHSRVPTSPNYDVQKIGLVGFFLQTSARPPPPPLKYFCKRILKRESVANKNFAKKNKQKLAKWESELCTNKLKGREV